MIFVQCKYQNVIIKWQTGSISMKMIILINYVSTQNIGF